MSEPIGPIKQGTWPDDCVQRAFVAGAEWQFHANGSAMLRGERIKAEQEAVKRYGVPPFPPAAPKRCPKCGAAGETFTADLDWCPACHHQWPGT